MVKKIKDKSMQPSLAHEIKSRVVDRENSAVIIEQVSAMPGQGVTSMFNFGQSFGVIKGICSALGIPIYFIRPVKWKKHFNLIGTEKDASRTKVIEMFPDLSPQLTKKKDSNKSDAILIGKYFVDHYYQRRFSWLKF